MGSPGGYSVNPGMYRVPDLLTEEQFIRYMKSTYGRDIEFTDGLSFNPSRALGRSLPVGPVDETDDEQLAPSSIRDVHLRKLNEMDFGQEPVVEEDKEDSEEKEETQKDAPSLPVGKSTSSSKK